MADTVYFVRMRGKILGPFSEQQLRDQHARGFFSVVHEVSTDRRNWRPASTIDGLFPTAGTEEEEERGKSPLPGPEEQWFYLSPGGDRTGPVSALVLRDMVLHGQLSPTTLVWKNGLSEWLSLKQAGFVPAKAGRAAKWFRGFKFPVWWTLAGVAAVIFLVGLGMLVSRLLKKSPGSLTTEQIVKQARPSVAVIKGNRGQGTGFLVRPGVVATNAHVVSDQFTDRLTVQFTSASGEDAQPKQAKIIHLDLERDLALLSVDLPVNTPLAPLSVVNNYQLRQGQWVLAIGNPAIEEKDDSTIREITLFNDVTSGEMSVEINYKRFRFFKISMSINQGYSGGPVLDDGANVIGVVAARALGQERMAFVIPASDLNKAIQTASRRSPEEIEKESSLHRAFVAFTWLDKTMRAYGKGLDDIGKQMEDVIKRGKSTDSSFFDAIVSIYLRVNKNKQDFSKDLNRNMSKILSDSHIDREDRDNFRELWATYQEMQRLFEKPDRAGPSYKEFRGEAEKLRKKYETHTDRLKVKFGTDN